MESSSRDGNTRPPYLPPEKPVYRSRINSLNRCFPKLKVQIWKGLLSPCLFNLYAEYIVCNAGLDEAQAGIKIAGMNINNLRYTDDITLKAENEEELKSLLMKVREESENLA